MAKFYPSDASVNSRDITPRDGKAFTFAELYPVLGCEDIEVVYFQDGRCLLIDEIGKIKGKPMNDQATFEAIAAGILMEGDYISGPAVLCQTNQLN
jgi:hypothetical protein